MAATKKKPAPKKKPAARKKPVPRAPKPVSAPEPQVAKVWPAVPMPHRRGLISYLFGKYLDCLTSPLDSQPLDFKPDPAHGHVYAMAKCVEWMEKQLKGNPPTSVFTAQMGLGLKLADGAEIPCVDYQQELLTGGGVGGHDPGYRAITQGRAHEGGDMSPTKAPPINVFGLG